MPVIPTAEQVAYMQTRLHESYVPAIHSSGSVCCAAAFIAVVLRLLSRRYVRIGYGADDLCIVLGLVFFILFIAGLSFSTRYGQGRHVLLVTNSKGLAINNIVNANIYLTALAFIKCSILFLYRRIFPVSWFRKALLGLAIFILSWYMITFFCGVFTCVPIKALWDPTVNGRCIHYGQVTLAFGVCNIATDFVMLLLPLPLVWKLQMPLQRKVLVSLTFMGGFIACIASIVRLNYAEQVESTYDPSWDTIPAAIVSNVELCTGFIAACIPTYRPLVERIFGHRNASGRQSASSGSRSQGWSIMRQKVVHQDEILLTSDISTCRVPELRTDIYADSSNNKSPVVSLDREH